VLNSVKAFIIITILIVIAGLSGYWFGLHDIGGTANTVREQYDAVRRINQQLAEDASELRQINNRLRTEIIESQRDVGQLRQNNSSLTNNNSEAAGIARQSKQILRDIRQGK
jgi:predicted nuclease with TOPRIM domain